jgi:sugar-phosphatase
MYQNKSVKRAILFDMDGVLIDSNVVIERAWCEAADMYGRHISEEEITQHIHGQPGAHTIRALFHDLPLVDQQKVQQHIIHVENTASYNVITGVMELISSLKAVGITMGIVTSGCREKIDRVITLLNAQSCISVIVERYDVARGKPYPDPYLLAAEHLGIPANQTVVFEDSQSGVTSAVAAGAYCVGIGGDNLLSHGAMSVIPDFRDVRVVYEDDSTQVLLFPSGHSVRMGR